VPAEYFLLSVLRAIVEVTGFIMLGQGMLYVLAGKSRQHNFVYQMFQIITRPVIKFTRLITPRFVRDDHMPIAAFMLVAWLWIGLAVAKRYLCVSQGLDCPA
jgi:hypothetical protein